MKKGCQTILCGSRDLMSCLCFPSPRWSQVTMATWTKAHPPLLGPSLCHHGAASWDWYHLGCSPTSSARMELFGTSLKDPAVPSVLYTVVGMFLVGLGPTPSLTLPTFGRNLKVLATRGTRRELLVGKSSLSPWILAELSQRALVGPRCSTHQVYDLQ